MFDIVSVDAAEAQRAALKSIHQNMNCGYIARSQQQYEQLQALRDELGDEVLTMRNDKWRAVMQLTRATIATAIEIADKAERQPGNNYEQRPGTACEFLQCIDETGEHNGYRITADHCRIIVNYLLLILVSIIQKPELGDQVVSIIKDAVEQSQKYDYHVMLGDEANVTFKKTEYDYMEIFDDCARVVMFFAANNNGVEVW